MVLRVPPPPPLPPAALVLLPPLPQPISADTIRTVAANARTYRCRRTTVFILPFLSAGVLEGVLRPPWEVRYGGQARDSDGVGICCNVRSALREFGRFPAGTRYQGR